MLNKFPLNLKPNALNYMPIDFASADARSTKISPKVMIPRSHMLHKANCSFYHVNLETGMLLWCLMLVSGLY